MRLEEYQFRIDAFTPDSLPMWRFADEELVASAPEVSGSSVGHPEDQAGAEEAKTAGEKEEG
jgi:hypothetical protein